jgi:CRP/FNR family transcriptional regulator, cyclic AMP receptor protein
MGATPQHTESHDSGAENAQTQTWLSPLHAIPGFERLSRRKLYPKGSALLVEGQAACGVYVLCAGRAKIAITSAEGRKLIVRIARPGDLLGLHATLAGHSHETTAETLAPCEVDFISRKELLGLLDKEKSYGLRIAIAVSKEFAEFVEQTRVLLLSAVAAQKLAGLLLTWGEAFGQPTTSGVHLQTLLTHEELGQMIGASRETVTRALNMLKRRQIIRALNGDIWIRNLVALASIAKMAR